MVDEPGRRQVGNPLERPGLFEEMGRARDDLEPVDTTEPALCLSVQFQDGSVGTADDQQSRRPDALEALVGQVGTAATRDHGGDGIAERRGGAECSGGAGRSPEIAARESGRLGLLARPTGCGHESRAEQADVEHVGAILLLVDGEQVEQQGCEAIAAEDGGDLTVATAEAAGATAVSEDHQTACTDRNGEIAQEACRRGGHLNRALTRFDSLTHLASKPRVACSGPTLGARSGFAIRTKPQATRWRTLMASPSLSRKIDPTETLPRRPGMATEIVGGSGGPVDGLVPFDDRADAGRQLARRLLPFDAEDPVVVAIPRGGVPVAKMIAEALQAPLQMLAVRKLGAPQNPEYGIGALAEDGTLVIDPEAIAVLRIHNGELDAIVARETAELRRRVRAYRGDRSPLDLGGRTVIVVDDGIATGVTDTAALRAARRRNPSRLILAVPVCAPDALERLRSEADEVVCLHVPRRLRSVGQYYRDFSQVSDEEVLDALESRADAAA